MTTTSEPMSPRRILLTRTALAVIGAAACIVFASVSPYFVSVDNLVNLLNDLAVAGIVAIPAIFLIMSGHVDLTVGAAAAFTGIVVASSAPGSGLFVAVVLAIACGALIGLVNGLLVTIAEVNSVAVTFASMSLLRGLAYLVPSGLAVYLPGFRGLGNAQPFLGLSLPFLIFLSLVALAVGFSRTVVGRRSRAVGLRPPAVRLDGGQERRWVVGLFVASGLAASITGLIRTSQLGTGLPTAAIGIEITVLTAVLLGGGQLAGGRGSVVGTLFALLVISIIDNGLALTNVTSYVGQVFHAGLLILALVIDRPLRRRRRCPAATDPLR
ncbi:ribose transport system permease protein [Nakamurella sp. UYEF19]|uniref:ABC transporter permease n=1 Tax=Nakamurella sp. UYEF19 TaxID=1756392 RepID=UPI00339ACAD4